jgi:hypothetical protein
MGREGPGEPASSLPGFALLGSGRELCVTHHQTDQADAAATAGTNLSVGMGESSFLLLFPVGQLNCPTIKMKPYCCRISQGNKLISLDRILGSTVEAVEAPVRRGEKGPRDGPRWHVFK